MGLAVLLGCGGGHGREGEFLWGLWLRIGVIVGVVGGVEGGIRGAVVWGSVLLLMKLKRGGWLEGLIYGW